MVDNPRKPVSLGKGHLIWRLAMTIPLVLAAAFVVLLFLSTVME
jgi:hypothetical protein